MPIQFPSNPTTGTSYVFGGREYIYNGERWGIIPVTVQGPTGYTGSQGIQGPVGPAGTSITIEGTTSTYAALPFPYLGTTGTGYILSDTGHLAVWGEGTWTDVGNVTGPIGYTGSQGDVGYTGSLGYTGSFGYTGSAGASFEGTYTGVVVFSNTTTAIDPYTGALVISGGVGIEGPVYIANTASYLGGALILTTATIADYANTSKASLDSTSTITVAAIVIGPGGYISFTKNTGYDPGDMGNYQVRRAPKQYTNYSDFTLSPYDTWLPGDMYYDDQGNSVYVLVESMPSVWDLAVSGTPGDSFITAASIPQFLNPITGLIEYQVKAGMTCRGDGFADDTVTINSDPLDFTSPAVTGPDGSGNYTIYISQPLDSALTTASFTAWVLLDITFKAS